MIKGSNSLDFPVNISLSANSSHIAVSLYSGNLLVYLLPKEVFAEINREGEPL